jgi:UTP--glucose-1-phosphate uridylyltransferase
MKVKKAVIPAAGLGTRFLPATKSEAKEMLPVVDKPAIQYVVEEAVRAGIEDILIITGRGKRTIEDHFDRSIELENRLEQTGKFDELKQVRAISDLAHIHYIRQPEPLGLGAAVALAEALVSGNPLGEMIGVYDTYGRSVIAVQEVPRSEIHLYGAVAGEFVGDNLVRATGVVEKPPADEAPSNLAIVHCYVLTPEIFDALRVTPPDARGEVQLTDALNLLAAQQAVYAHVFEGIRYDVGNKLGYLRATVELAADREDLGPGFRDFLTDFVQRRKLL